MTIHCGDYRRAKRDEDTLWNLSFRRVKRGEISFNLNSKPYFSFEV
jgi:hypothetical protein